MECYEKNCVNLIISGDNVDFDMIQSLIPLKQKHNRKGDKLLLSYYVEIDNISFGDLAIDNKFSIDEKIAHTLDILTPYKDIIRNLAKRYAIRLRIYFQSTMAQMFFYINSDNIRRISEFNMSVETSIFSEGMCEDRPE